MKLELTREDFNELEALLDIVDVSEQLKQKVKIASNTSWLDPIIEEQAKYYGLSVSEYNKFTEELAIAQEKQERGWI